MRHEAQAWGVAEPCDPMPGAGAAWLLLAQAAGTALLSPGLQHDLMAQSNTLPGAFAAEGCSSFPNFISSP